jgi:hypothetical protein
MRIVRHKWKQDSYPSNYDKCIYCGTKRIWNMDLMNYIYSNNYHDRLYRAPECKRIYLSDKVL